MNSILLPLQLESDYHSVLDYAQSIARRSQAHISLIAPQHDKLFRTDERFVYDSSQFSLDFYQKINKDAYRQKISFIFESLKKVGISFQFIVSTAYDSVRAVEQECDETQYDLVVIQQAVSASWMRWFSVQTSRLVYEVDVPVFIVPLNCAYNEINHITYAVDLEDYDPKIIQQLKKIASLFDANLTIMHVNKEEDEQDEYYRENLESTICDTLDYPKVKYRFFDHADILSGIKGFTQKSNTNLLAMINRHEPKPKILRRWFDRSITRKMIRQASVPVLAFRKGE